MRKGRFYISQACTLMLVTLAATICWAAGAISESQTDSAVLASADPGFDRRSAIAAGRPVSHAVIALRLGKAKDEDGDGIRDRDDECPQTPMGALVDPRGCPADPDQDGIFDGIDQCADTARGATVDAAGCPRDTDADGVLDGLDKCPETDPRALVRGDGCPYDSDGDGLLDGIDQCPATPTGAEVDERGCRIDADEDGVADGLDKCPGTSLGSEADESGCSRAQRGEILLPTVRFNFGSARLAPGSSPALNRVADILKQNPNLTVEVGGHTDNTGPAQRNRQISLDRANEVKRYLAARGVPKDRMVTKGYGEVHPIASNRDAAGRAENRRIEFKILSP